MITKKYKKKSLSANTERGVFLEKGTIPKVYPTPAAYSKLQCTHLHNYLGKKEIYYVSAVKQEKYWCHIPTVKLVPGKVEKLPRFPPYKLNDITQVQTISEERNKNEFDSHGNSRLGLQRGQRGTFQNNGRELWSFFFNNKKYPTPIKFPSSNKYYKQDMFFLFHSPVISTEKYVGVM